MEPTRIHSPRPPCWNPPWANSRLWPKAITPTWDDYIPQIWYCNRSGVGKRSYTGCTSQMLGGCRQWPWIWPLPHWNHFGLGTSVIHTLSNAVQLHKNKLGCSGIQTDRAPPPSNWLRACDTGNAELICRWHGKCTNHSTYRNDAVKEIVPL